MPSRNFLRKSSLLLVEFFMALLLNSTGHNNTNTSSSNWSLSQTHSSLQALVFHGHLDFNNTSHAATDFGNRYHFLPAAVLYPESVSDISMIVKHVFQTGPNSELTVAARGHGHSLQGQAQAHQGIVVNMESLASTKMHVHTGASPYVDASGGELWINVLHETLQYGLAPKSWTDYLHLTVGGTLSNAGISGQTFRHGPQISNVHQLQVVTGRGDVVVCSEKHKAELFYGVLGGLGQFGIITRARISLEPAPKRVKWIRVLYSDFYTFTKDQEYLISQENSSFDYIEGFVVINRTGLLSSWRPTFNPESPVQAEEFRSDGKTLYCLEVAKYFSPEDEHIMNQVADALLSKLNYIEYTLFYTQVSYIEFLDRVHLSEKKLREKGLWDVPHPWLSLLVPRSSIHKFGEEVFGNILTETSNGLILVYPVNQSRWPGIEKTSMATPEEDVMYLVGFLSSAEHVVAQNKQILGLCGEAKLGVKQYLPHYETQEGWKAHFEHKWEGFARTKSVYDPLGMLAPGQRIFQRAGNGLLQHTLHHA